MPIIVYLHGKTLTHCDHGNYFLRRSKRSFLECSVTSVFRIHSKARDISRKFKQSKTSDEMALISDLAVS